MNNRFLRFLLLLNFIVLGCINIFTLSSNFVFNCSIINGISWTENSKYLLLTCIDYNGGGLSGMADSSIMYYDPADSKVNIIQKFENTAIKNSIIINESIFSHYCGGAIDDPKYCGIRKIYPENIFLSDGRDMAVESTVKKLAIFRSSKTEMEVIEYSPFQNTEELIFRQAFTHVTNPFGMDWKKNIIAISMKILLNENNGSTDIYIINVNEKVMRKITNGGTNSSPSVSPDGKLISYCGKEYPEYYLHIYDLESGEDMIYYKIFCTYTSWSPDGKYIAVADLPHEIEIINTKELPIYL